MVMLFSDNYGDGINNGSNDSGDDDGDDDVNDDGDEDDDDNEFTFIPAFALGANRSSVQLNRCRGEFTTLCVR